MKKKILSIIMLVGLIVYNLFSCVSASSMATNSWYLYYTNTNSNNHISETLYLPAARYYVSKLTSKNEAANQNVTVSFSVGTETKIIYVVGAEYTLPNSNSGNADTGRFTLRYISGAGSASVRGQTIGAS